jgi:hypothetical protein
MHRDDSSSQALVQQIDGFLRWQAEVEQAHRQARAFTDQLPWLTTAQREDIERVYVEDRTTAARVILQLICDRAGELREEYSARYTRLKARCVATTAGGVCLLVGIAALVLLLR